MSSTINNTSLVAEPDWGNTAPAWRLPGWAEPIVRCDFFLKNYLMYANTLTDGREHISWIDDHNKEKGILNFPEKG